MKKIAIILSGCGVYDGSEIHEAVLTMLSISKQGASYKIFAPDKMQHHVINHLNGEAMPEQRNVLVESARIARGKIQPLSSYNESDFDALVIPGGFGVAKNLCSFAIDGANFTIDTETEKAIKETHQSGKPIGVMCISPVLISGILKGTNLTIGKDKVTADIIIQKGSNHIEAGYGEVVIDKQNKIVSTPCYMLDSSIYQISLGTDKLIEAVLQMS